MLAASMSFLYGRSPMSRSILFALVLTAALLAILTGTLEGHILVHTLEGH